MGCDTCMSNKLSFNDEFQFVLQILSHSEDNCSLAPIPCPYAEMGCSKKVFEVLWRARAFESLFLFYFSHFWGAPPTSVARSRFLNLAFHVG